MLVNRTLHLLKALDLPAFRILGAVVADADEEADADETL